MTNPIFIGGVGRSGTTLLRLMLDTHPNICCGPELKILPTICHLYRQLLGPFRAAMDDYRNDPADIARSVRILVSELTCKYRDPDTRWAEKTPQNINDFLTLGEIFPDAQFVHMVRDGRDVACSLVEQNWVDLQTGFRPEYTTAIGKAAKHWRETVDHARRQAAHPLLVDRVIEIKYEDLVLKTEPTLRKLFEFIDEPWDDAVLKYYEVDRSAETDDPNMGRACDPITSDSIGRWKDKFTTRDEEDYLAATR